MSDSPLRLVFAGTPEFAAVSLAALIDTVYEPVAVYCQPDRPAGRGRKLRIGPVKQLALEQGIEVFQPQNFKSQEAIDTLAALKPDVLIVVAYGLILPQSVLDIPTFGAINVHASLLPRWRGAAPIQRAILAGDKETGITTMQMDAGLDTGDMLLKQVCPILPEDSTATLHDRLADLGGKTLLETLELLSAGKLSPQAQDETQTCYAQKIAVSEAALDWTLAADKLALSIRAFNPVPVAHCFYNEDRYKIWSAKAIAKNSDLPPGSIIDLNKQGLDIQTGDGTLRVTKLQAPGKRAMQITDYVNGNAVLSIGSAFS